ncbi:MAG TPA: hypothetical protein VGK73_06680 [Polyangiaceae bacterium]
MADEIAATAPVEAAEPAAEVTEAPAAKPESLREQWDRISERGPDAPEEKKPAAEAEKADGDEKKPDDKPAKPPKPKREEKPGTEQPPANELEAMRQQAQRLGLIVEDGRVTTAERAAFRNAQRKAAEQRAAEEQSLLERVRKAQEEAAPKFERADKIESAIQAGDWEALATAFGFKPIPAAGDKPALSAWDALIQDQIDRKADPNYQRLRALEIAASERAQRDEQAAKEAQARQQQQEEAQRRANYVNGLSTSMKASKDPFLAAFHDDPALVDAVFRIQQQEYRATGRAPAPEQAVRMKLQGVTMTPLEFWKSQFDRGSKVFGPKETPAAPPANLTEAAKVLAAAKAPRTTTPPVPAARKNGKWNNDREEMNDMVRRLQEAATREAAEKRKAGAR